MGFQMYTGGRYVLGSNVSATVKMGPFLSSANGNTVMDSLTIAQADVRLSKNDGAYAQKAESSSATHDENGWYDVNLSGTDTNTTGNVLIAIHVTGALPVFRMFEVSQPAP